MLRPLKVMAMHDICGYGRASLTVVTPILSVLNKQVCPLPTALLSNHFGLSSNPSFLNLGSELEQFIECFKREQFSFDAFYSGYLADPTQVEIAIKYIKEFNPQWIYIDPVLGDDMELYPGFDHKQVDMMKHLVSYADIISPNITEAAFLLGKAPDPFLSITEGKKMLVELAELGPKYVCITGVKNFDEKEISVLSLDKENNRFFKTSMPSFNGTFHGTGDSFASALLGNIMNGVTLTEGINRSMTYLYESIKLAIKFDSELCIEPTLYILLEGIQKAQTQEI